MTTSTERPDLPTFDGRTALDHAEAAAESIRAINHITSWSGGGLTYPSDAYAVLQRLAAAAAMLPQACQQIDRTLSAWHTAGLIGIDSGAKHAGNPAAAVAAASEALFGAVTRACQMWEALHQAAEALAHAHSTDIREATD